MVITSVLTGFGGRFLHNNFGPWKGNCGPREGEELLSLCLTVKATFNIYLSDTGVDAGETNICRVECDVPFKTLGCFKDSVRTLPLPLFPPYKVLQGFIGAIPKILGQLNLCIIIACRISFVKPFGFFSG